MDQTSPNNTKVILLVIFILVLILGVWFFVSKKSEQPTDTDTVKNDVTAPVLTREQIMQSFTAPTTTSTKTTDPKVLNSYTATKNSNSKPIDQTTLNSFSTPSSQQ